LTSWLMRYARVERLGWCLLFAAMPMPHEAYGKAALAAEAIDGRDGRDRELQIRVVLADQADVGERVDHHADATVGELVDLVCSAS